MAQRRHGVRAALTATAATALLTFATPAWAATTVTHPTLRQAGQHILASNGEFNQGFGKCAGTDQQAGQDIWVFVWPGKGVVSLDAVKIGWDTNDDGTADTFKSLADGHFTTDSGTKKVWFATPAGWKLENGESTIHGTVPQNKFNLTHTCAGTTGSPSPSPSTSPSTSPSASESPSASPSASGSPSASESPSGSPSESPTGGTSVSPSTSPVGGTEGGLPLTGVAATSIALTGVLLIGGGVVLMTLRRRRDKVRFTS